MAEAGEGAGEATGRVVERGERAVRSLLRTGGRRGGSPPIASSGSRKVDRAVRLAGGNVQPRVRRMAARAGAASNY